MSSEQLDGERIWGRHAARDVSATLHDGASSGAEDLAACLSHKKNVPNVPDVIVHFFIFS